LTAIKYTFSDYIKNRGKLLKVAFSTIKLREYMYVSGTDALASASV
jgi:hypothetical protein